MRPFIPTILLLIQFGFSQKILIPMDQAQKDHLKAYGTAYWILNENINVEWILNYRGGTFLIDSYPDVEQECRVRGVSYEVIGAEQILAIYNEVEVNNMDVVLLEKAPKIAIYTPPGKQPWDDAVTLALTYAEIPYETLWDEEVFNGTLGQYDWLHLHHEDFTGQYGKFYRNYHTAAWYIDQKQQFESMAQKLGYHSVHAQKKALAQMIKNYVANGGFLFAMCSATDSFDIALAAINVDAAHSVYDDTPIDKNAVDKMDFNQTLAFTNFIINPDPMVYEYSDIDYPPSDNPIVRGAEADYFTLFEFSAKYDPVPTMLTQNHVTIVKGFMGQTTGFNRDNVKKHVLIMGEDTTTPQVKYLHGNQGQGTFTFLGGHDPEDYQHFVGDPETDLSLHKNSPGYRLILNNVLFPAARKKERKLSMDLQMVTGDLESAIMVSTKIPEFDSPYNIEEYNKRLDESELVLTAELDGHPVGFKVGYDRFKDGSFYSWMGGVIPNYRGRGIASNLADVQEDWAKSNGYTSIKLKTRNKHEAMIAFAIDRGFDIIDSEPSDDIREMRIWMEKKL